ncbi:MAG: acyl-CoA dehydrogenase family protein [Acidimicrobiia bacterium]|nr:MAG: acyl-CoA dehydrogenase family protein [Acidimicrobiia bacterium]
MTEAYSSARRAFVSWRQSVPPGRYDPHIDLVNARYLSGDRLGALREAGTRFGRVVVDGLGPVAESYQQHDPELDRYDGLGNRIEAIRFDPAYHDAGRLVWASGIVGDAGEPGASFEQATSGYLASTEGEFGHMCAATCTTGMIRVLRRFASDDITDRYLSALTDADYDSALRGAQFLTEVQGGSDVGALASVATDHGDGTWRVSGEKWFCSVADADLFLVLARPDGAPEGTEGLGCFLLPRLVDQAPNGFSIRRLKEKLGTRSMASAEVDFDDAVAYPIGPTSDGFKIMVTAMLNTSRWMNAVGDVGIMRRAYVEAAGYARYREAFGQLISTFPLVRRQLAELKVDWLAALHSTWHLTNLDEAVDLGVADEADAGFYRYLVNANKLACSLAATKVVRGAIEILGGNGAIETFSVLPRLLRDAIVYEQWEGTHNVLTAQVLRDLGRLDLTGSVLDRTAMLLEGITDAELGKTAESALVSFEEIATEFRRCVEDPMHGALHGRHQLERLVAAHQVALLLDAAAAGGDLTTELAAAARLLTGRSLDRAYRAEHDPEFAATIDALLGPDLDR